mmetsp:Transcript_17545/g.37940  ORF Transcript_17545/g.37940 Transcript_17545/m.37940 type:complete len:278 (+) Transcript_17545:742-1575(+)
MIYGRVEVVYPPVPDLLSRPARELGGEVGPLGEGRVLVARVSPVPTSVASLVSSSACAARTATAREYDAQDNSVLLLPPLPLATAGLEVPCPPVVALPRRPPHPVFHTELVPVHLRRLVVGHDLGEAKVLLRGPPDPRGLGPGEGLPRGEGEEGDAGLLRRRGLGWRRRNSVGRTVIPRRRGGYRRARARSSPCVGARPPAIQRRRGRGVVVGRGRRVHGVRRRRAPGHRRLAAAALGRGDVDLPWWGRPIIRIVRHDARRRWGRGAGLVLLRRHRR